MTIKLATSYLLAILTGTAALAQTHPQKKLVRKHAVVRQPLAKSVAVQVRREWIGVDPLLPPTTDDIAAVEIPDSMKVYTYVEQMPMLNGQRGFLVIITAINQRLIVPPSVPNGRVFVQFEVNRQGTVNHPKIIKSLRADIDSAVVAATRQLPCFTPGKQNGRVVRVSFTLPITIPVAKQP
jgi:TonB family protein